MRHQEEISVHRAEIILYKAEIILGQSQSVPSVAASLRRNLCLYEAEFVLI
jgi:hypothetical protein